MQGPTSPAENRVGPAARLLAGGILLAVPFFLIFLAAQHPARRGFIPPCPTVWLGRFYCPGCGALRTVHFALNGDLAAAWRHNPLLLIVGPPLAVVLIVALLSVALRGRWLWPMAQSPRARTTIAWTLTLAILIFGIARNLPGSTWDRLRPPPPPPPPPTPTSHAPTSPPSPASP